MLEIKVKNNFGEILNLSSSTAYTLYKVEGITPPKINISTSANATSDGDTVNSVRAEKRNIVLYLKIDNDVENNRLKLYRHFPLKKNLTVYCKTDTRDMCIEGKVELIEPALFDKKQAVQISIICPQPYFKAIDDLVTNFAEISSLFEFPFSISNTGKEFSVITNNVRKSIVNNGEFDTGVEIKIFATGEVVNPVIYDAFRRTHIKLNMTLQTNDTVVINTNKGKKSITLIRSGVESNAMGNLAATSKWLQLYVGDNVFTYTADSGSSNLQLTFISSPAYGGV